MIGTKFAQFEIVSHLGTGGMGEVYRAMDSKLGRSVAIKLLPEAFSHDGDRVARFEREARVLASLNHPNIAAIHGIEESGGRRFLIMELVVGETLAERVQRGPMPVDEAIDYGKQIADGLESAHAKGIVHRDLKPANVMITGQGRVKLLDFGLARAIGGHPAEINLSNAPCDGLAEEIINALVQVPDLKVIARTSAFAFKGQNTDIRRIAEALGVTTVLEGSVRKAGNRIRVTAQLITAADGSHLWSQRYDREMEDVFAVQDEIAVAIAEALKVKLALRTAKHQPNLPAYEAYLKYRHYQWGFTPESLQLSRECLEQAIALDPKFALPYVGLADFHLASSAIGGMSSQEGMPKARTLAQRALELDPDLPEAHGMLGIVAGHYDLDWKESERRFNLAMAHEPVTCHARQWYALFYLFATGRTEEAHRQMQQVLEQDPLSQMWHYTMSCVVAAMQLDTEALAWSRKGIELDPHFWFGRAFLGLLHARLGQQAEARECGEKAYAAAPWSPHSIGLLAGAMMNAGETRQAEELLAKLGGDFRETLGLAVFHFVCGEIDKAVEWFGKAADQRFIAIVTILIRPFEPVLRQSPGWPGLLRKLNLNAATTT